LIEAKYTEILERDVWTGANTTGTGSAFTMIGRKCFNCGDPSHMADKCPRTKDQQRINANIKKFNEAIKQNKRNKTANNENKDRKSKAKSPKGKYSPPTNTEKNRRIIDGKPMYYLTKTKRWVPDKNPPSSTNVLLTSIKKDGNSNNNDKDKKEDVSNANENGNTNQQLKNANAHLAIKETLLALASQIT